MKIIKLNETKDEKFKLKANEDFFIIGYDNFESNLDFEITEENVEVNVYMLIVGAGYDYQKVISTMNHVVPGSRSRVHVKGLFDGDAKFEFEGMIKIGVEASLSDAYLKNDNLVMGENVIINSSPQLEIANQDVKASHGVTIKTIELLEEYYLRSRGLNSKESQRLIISGFLRDFISKLETKDMEEVSKIKAYAKYLA